MTTPETQEVSTGMTEDEAASALLKRWVDEPAEADEPEQTEQEQTEQVDAQAEEEPEDEAEESDEVEIDVTGEKIKFPKAVEEQAKRIEAKVKEIEAGTTRKFQEAAELRKVAESQIQAAQQLQKIAHEQSDLIADHKMVQRRLESLEKLDINALAESDPVALTRINAEYNQLMAAKSRIEQAYQQTVAQSQEQQSKASQARLQALGEFAKKNIKGWSDEYSQTLLEFTTKELGIDPDTLRASLSEPVIKALDLAYRGWKVSQADPKAKLQVASKTLKPGSTAQTKSTALAAAEKATQRLRKSGSVDDAAMALLMRSSAKRR